METGKEEEEEGGTRIPFSGGFLRAADPGQAQPGGVGRHSNVRFTREARLLPLQGLVQSLHRIKPSETLFLANVFVPPPICHKRPSSLAKS